MKEILNTANEIVRTNPMQEIRALMQQIQQEGNVDSELTAFNCILEKIKKEEITPEEGLTQAQHMIDRRQNYH
ncbi:MAG: hypothetical protein NTX85_02705 [Candidatus Nomurabacteria bacterium]|nr:hypothetical protein [Candidatus Nomurabacteria bacterium]